MPDQFQYRDDEFMLVFPCFAIESSNGKGFVYFPYDKGNAVAVFSDEDLVERYRAAHNLPGKPIRFDDAIEFLPFFEQLPPAITLLSIDPGDSRPNVITLDHAKELVLRHKGLL